MKAKSCYLKDRGVGFVDRDDDLRILDASEMPKLCWSIERMDTGCDDLAGSVRFRDPLSCHPCVNRGTESCPDWR